MNVVLRLIAERLGSGLVTLFAVVTLIFFAVELLPGDIAREILGQTATEETVAAFRRELGLDRPLLERYVAWLGGVVSGDFGTSLANGREISELLGDRLVNTLTLAGVTAVIAVPLAVVLGILTALWRNSAFDRLANVLTLGSISFPEFFIAYVLIYVFAAELGLFPSISTVAPGMSAGDMLYRLALPALTLLLVTVAHMMRMTRASIIALLASPYIEMAHLKGLKPWRVIVRHALPNALAPIANVVAINLAFLIVGVVVVEVVFVYPGLGQLLVDSVSKRDVTVVQACTLVFAATYIILNLIADIVAILANPRLVHPR